MDREPSGDGGTATGYMQSAVRFTRLGLMAKEEGLVTLHNKRIVAPTRVFQVPCAIIAPVSALASRNVEPQLLEFEMIIGGHAPADANAYLLGEEIVLSHTVRGGYKFGNRYTEDDESSAPGATDMLVVATMFYRIPDEFRAPLRG